MLTKLDILCDLMVYPLWTIDIHNTFHGYLSKSYQDSVKYVKLKQSIGPMDPETKGPTSHPNSPSTVCRKREGK